MFFGLKKWNKIYSILLPLQLLPHLSAVLGSKTVPAVSCSSAILCLARSSRAFAPIFPQELLKGSRQPPWIQLQGQFSVLIVFDLAFGTVDHMYLLNTLLFIDLVGKTCSWFYCYLTGHAWVYLSSFLSLIRAPSLTRVWYQGSRIYANDSQIYKFSPDPSPTHVANCLLGIFHVQHLSPDFLSKTIFTRSFGCLSWWQIHSSCSGRNLGGIFDFSLFTHLTFHLSENHVDFTFKGKCRNICRIWPFLTSHASTLVWAITSLALPASNLLLSKLSEVTGGPPPTPILILSSS